MTTLERRCRQLLLAYPADYRGERGEEIVSTMLDSAGPGQRFPSLRDVADLVWHALRRRCWVSADFDAGVAIAAPWALAAAAGIAVFVWWQVEPVIPTAGPVVYVAWVVAAVIARRAAIVAAIVTTLGSPLLAFVMQTERPPLWIIMSLIALGVTACSGLGRPNTEQRLSILAGAAAVAASCALVKPALPGYYQPVLTRIGVVLAIGVLVTFAVAFRRGRAYLYAGLLLAIPAAWVGPIDAVNWQIGLDHVTAARFGRLAHVVMATCVILAMLAWLSPRIGSAARASGIALGSAVGYVAFSWFAVGGLSWPPPIIAMLALSVLLGRPSWTAAAVSAVTYLGLAGAIGIYSNNWSAIWNDPMRTVVLVSMLTMAPCAYAAYHLLRDKKLTWRRGVALAISLGWAGYLTVPAVEAWGPLLWVLAAMTLAAVVKSRRADPQLYG